MTPEEARLNLDATTLRPRDAAEEARVLAAEDAKLGAWLEKRTAFDQQVSEAMNEIVVPSALRAQLLQTLEKESPVRKSGGFMPIFWLAAAAVLMLGAASLWWKGSDGMPAWKSDALAMVQKIDAGQMPLDHMSPQLAELKALLAQAKSPAPLNLPKNFDLMKSLGCKKFEVAGHPASVICFHLDGQGEAHLVVFNQKDLEKAPLQHQPTFEGHGKWQVVTWSDGALSYLVATKAPESALRQLFTSLGLGKASWIPRAV
ncbi:hypothetical protein BH11VER1_BH11VER1_32630 [soil metagenome]